MENKTGWEICQINDRYFLGMWITPPKKIFRKQEPTFFSRMDKAGRPWHHPVYNWVMHSPPHPGFSSLQDARDYYNKMFDVNSKTIQYHEV